MRRVDCRRYGVVPVEEFPWARQTHANQSLHAFSSPLGTGAVMKRDGRGLSHILTLVCQIDLGVTRLLWIGKESTIESFQGFFTTMGEEIKCCSDIWEPDLKVIREKCSGALHILDRLHIVAKDKQGS
jgi:hypothetical protein